MFPTRRAGMSFPACLRVLANTQLNEWVDTEYPRCRARPV
jgi:hypothetical protein